MRRLVLRSLAATFLACASLTAPALAAPAVTLTAAFSPERLGAETTVHVAFAIAHRPGEVSSPVREVRVLYPRELGIGTSGLGLESCSAILLEQHGLAGCPGNSLMGYGSAVVEVPFGPHVVLERAPITILSEPVLNGDLGLLFFVSGDFPVIADLVFEGRVLASSAQFGGMIDTKLPLVPSVPRGPDVALVGLSTTIGPAGITYHETVGGRTIAFHPRGVVLPPRCPRGGFPFAVDLRFQDGSESQARTTVPCPRGRAAHSRHHPSHRS